MGNHSLAPARTQSKPQVHPIWALFALPAMLLLLFSDAGNNLSIVHMFSSGELSLWSWQGLALGAAIASAPLGYTSGIKQWLVIPTGVVCLLGGILTVMSTNTDFAGKSADAIKYERDFSALESERATLLESLRPTDDSPSCAKQRWCDSQAKERRLAQINTMMAFVEPEVDPLATPAGQFLSQAISYLRAFGVPFVVAALAHILGLMFHGKFSGIFRNVNSSVEPVIGGSFQEKKSQTARISERNRVRETSVEKAVELAKEWLQEQSTGRISKEKLKVACKIRGHKTTSRVIALLIEAGELLRYDNGQLAKPESRELRLVT